MRLKPLEGTRLNTGHWAVDGLVSYYLMTGGGTRVHDLWGENHLDFQNAATVWTAHQQGRAVDHNAYGILCASAKNLPISRGTFSSWCSQESLGANGGLITLHDGTNTQRLFYFWNGASAPDSQIQFNTNGSGGSAIVTYTTPVPGHVANKMQHVACTWNLDTETYIIYLDGQALASDGGTGAHTNPSGLDQITVGGFHLPATFGMNGQFSQASVYNRDMTAAEIMDLYTYPFDELESSPDYFWIGAVPFVGGGNAPTGNINGPLVGCLGGPI